MNRLRRAIVAAVLVSAGAVAASSASAGQIPGQLDVTVNVTGGGSDSAIRIDVIRNSDSTVVQTGSGSGSFDLEHGAYRLEATPTVDGYVVTSVACADDRGGNTNGTPDFVIQGPGGVDEVYEAATCVVEATYTEPPPEPTVPPTEPTTPPTEPTTPPTEPTTPPTEPTVPPTEPTVPPTEPTVPPTTDDQAAVPPAAGETTAPPAATAAPTIPVTGANAQTLPIALLALGFTMLGVGAVLSARRS